MNLSDFLNTDHPLITYATLPDIVTNQNRSLLTNNGFMALLGIAAIMIGTTLPLAMALAAFLVDRRDLRLDSPMNTGDHSN